MILSNILKNVKPLHIIGNVEIEVTGEKPLQKAAGKE